MEAAQTLHQLSHGPSHQRNLLFNLERTLFAVFLMSDMSSSSSSLVSMGRRGGAVTRGVATVFASSSGRPSR